MKNSLKSMLNPVSGGFYMKPLIDASNETNQLRGFVSADSSSHFTRILRAEIVSAAGAILKQAFLLMPKDEYSYDVFGFSQIGNPDIDKGWEALLLAAQNSGSLSILGTEKNMEGKHIPFDALFYCRSRGVYFEPVCPRCFETLGLCRDDLILAQAGLPAYSSSLKRYMHCPDCNASGKADVFYSSQKRSDDPVQVKCQDDLIRDFVNILVKSDPCIPCTECEMRAECYGEEFRALDNIVPFAFYPFYVLLGDACTLNAQDFLMILSGAGVDDVKDQLKARGLFGRLHALESFMVQNHGNGLLLFDQEERAFLEILYLKIAFLSDLTKLFLNNFGSGAPLLQVSSPESVWVKISDCGKQLPRFWNFTTELLDIFWQKESGAELPEAPDSFDVYLLGRFWIYSLISNHRVARKEIDALLRRFLKNPEEILSENLFDAGNIFYNDSLKVRAEWEEIWRQALGLGLSIMKSAYQGNADFNPENTVRMLDDLMDNIRKQFFAPSSSIPWSAEHEKVSAKDDNSELVEILGRIFNRWSAQDAQEKPVKPEGTALEDDFEKTVMISKKDAKAKTDVAREPEDIHETVILSAETLSEIINKSQTAHDHEDKARQKIEAHDEESLDATIVMSGNNAKTAPVEIEQGKGIKIKSSERDINDDELAETVIIKPGK